MSRRLRVLLIGRHFWPQGSIDSAGALIQMACGLRRHGVHVEVLTPRHDASWPEFFTFREIPVHRPTVAPRSDWAMNRYTRHLTTWLRLHGSSYDLLVVDGIRDEAAAAIEASRSLGCPTLLLSSRSGTYSDATWWTTSRSARRCAVIGKMADAVVVRSAACQRGLIAAGYAANRVHCLEPGFVAGPTRSATTRRLARRTLAAVNSDLIAGDDTPVVICYAAMTQGGGLDSLVKATRHLVAKYPDLRLWFIGDGPYRDWIYEYFSNEGVRASIAMPGTFCDLEDLFAAADVYVQTDDDGLEFFLPSAISAELPIVAVENEAVRAVIAGANPDRSGHRTSSPESDPGQWIQWCPAPSPKMMRISLVRVLDDLPAARARATLLRRSLLRNRPQTNSIESYLALMGQLVARKPVSVKDASIEAIS